MRTQSSACCVCHRTEDRTLNEQGKMTCELRPYGPGGAPICYQCAFETPEMGRQTSRNFATILDAATVIGEGVATITDHGIEPGLPDRPES